MKKTMRSAAQKAYDDHNKAVLRDNLMTMSYKYNIPLEDPAFSKAKAIDWDSYTPQAFPHYKNKGGWTEIESSNLHPYFRSSQ